MERGADGARSPALLGDVVPPPVAPEGAQSQINAIVTFLLIVALFHSHGLGEVAGLIHIAASPDRDMVGEQLQRDDREDRRQEIACSGSSIT